MKDLSARERQILGLASAGLLDKNIAIELDISPNTLRTYWARIRQKCGSLPRGALTAAFVRGEFSADGPTIVVPQSESVLAETTDPDTLRQAVIYYATALQRLEDRIRNVDRACRVLAAYPRLGFRAHNADELTLTLCRILVEEGGYVMAWVGIVEHDEAKSMSVLASYGDSHGYLEGIKVGWGDDAVGGGPSGNAVRTGKVQINQDFLANPNMEPWRDQAIKSGFQSSIGLPLRDGTTVFGVLSAYASEPDSFSSPETNLLDEIANDCAVRLIEFRRHESSS